MPEINPPLKWEPDSTRLHDQLAARGAIDPTTGERFTVRRIDDAIGAAVDAVNARHGLSIVDLFVPVWRLISLDLALELGLGTDRIEGQR